MSEPIQAISQGNYILHNIDAKKLYVQEPLFTANSGDAVYVGWRPDETVLYSGDRTSAASLSENPTNFNKIRVIDIYHNVYEFQPSTAGDAHQEIKMTNYTGQPQMLFVQFSGTQTKYYITKGFQEIFNTWDVPNTTLTVANLNNTYSREIITEIVGINRKENA